jgi:hypothetical protein
VGHDPHRQLTVVMLTNLQYSRSGELPANTIGKRPAGAALPERNGLPPRRRLIARGPALSEA